MVWLRHQRMYLRKYRQLSLRLNDTNVFGQTHVLPSVENLANNSLATNVEPLSATPKVEVVRGDQQSVSSPIGQIMSDGHLWNTSLSISCDESRR